MKAPATTLLLQLCKISSRGIEIAKSDLSFSAREREAFVNPEVLTFRDLRLCSLQFNLGLRGFLFSQERARQQAGGVYIVICVALALKLFAAFSGSGFSIGSMALLESQIRKQEARLALRFSFTNCKPTAWERS